MDPYSVEGSVALSCQGAGQVRLAASWGTEQQDSSSYSLAVALEQLGVLQRENNVDPELLLDVIHTADIFECHPYDFSLEVHSSRLASRADCDARCRLSNRFRVGWVFQVFVTSHCKLVQFICTHLISQFIVDMR